MTLPRVQVSMDPVEAERLRVLEYEKYIRSPFSFIDKVIESPYTEEFVYLNPRGAYDLEIIKHDNIDPENYYTMSRAGVTQFYYTDTDFTSLDQWEREYFLYTKVILLPCSACVFLCYVSCECGSGCVFYACIFISVFMTE
jgi:hypothetical protein